ncbi:MAG: POTRA domain-containing protein, partial [Rubrivivax sp.]|nr:POTRA domain-containing protein [Rubrivivax sp.]
MAATGLTAQAADEVASSGPRFAISRFAVDGNSLLPSAEVDGVLTPFAGPQRSFGDVRRAVEALQQAYLQRGYSVVLVQLPEQELAQGVVRLKVIEPRIGSTRVEGNQLFSTGNIRASLPALREGVTPNIRDISASLKVANTNPAKQLTLALQTADQPETVDAVVSVTED